MTWIVGAAWAAVMWRWWAKRRQRTRAREFVNELRDMPDKDKLDLWSAEHRDDEKGWRWDD